MIEIYWLWLPLIVTLVLFILAFIFERDNDYGFFTILCGVVGVLSIFIYAIAGIFWLLDNVKIVI